MKYNCSSDPDIPRIEMEILYDNIFHLWQFLAGRTMWAGGTETVEKYPVSNYNCAFRIVDSLDAFRDGSAAG